MPLRKIKNKKSGSVSLLFLQVILLAVLGPVNSYSQVTQGKIRYLVTQNFEKQITSARFLSKETRDRIKYMSGGGEGWKTYMNMYFTPEVTHYVRSEESAEKESLGFSWKEEEFFIHRDLAKGRITDLRTFLGKTYVIEDALVFPKWKILNDIKEVAGHLCMDASCADTLRDQNIIAWFALDLPISGGPENLCGLPGMILEVNINDGAMVISADKIDLTDVADKLKLPAKIKGKKINQTQYSALLKKYFDEKRKAQEFPFFGIRYL